MEKSNQTVNQLFFVFCFFLNFYGKFDLLPISNVGNTFAKMLMVETLSTTNNMCFLIESHTNIGTESAQVNSHFDESDQGEMLCEMGTHPPTQRGDVGNPGTGTRRVFAWEGAEHSGCTRKFKSRDKKTGEGQNIVYNFHHILICLKSELRSAE